MNKTRNRIFGLACAAALATVCHFALIDSRGGRKVPRRDRPAPALVSAAGLGGPVEKIQDSAGAVKTLLPTREENCAAARMLAHVRTWEEFENAVRRLPVIFARENPRMKTVLWNHFRLELVSFNGPEGAFQLLRGHLLELPGLVKSISLTDDQARSLVTKVCTQAIVQNAAASFIAGFDPERMRSPETEEYQWTAQVIYAMLSVKGMESALEEIQNPEYAQWKELMETGLFRDGSMVDAPATARYFIDQYSASSVEALRRDAHTVFSEWSRTDPEAASSAIDQMAVGFKKDAAIAAMVRAIQSVDQNGAQAWLDQISDVDLQRELSSEVSASGKVQQPAGPK